jgi:glutaredoxin
MSYGAFIVKVPGENRGDIFMYTLSTCIWCKKTKALLAELGAEYSYVDVDLVEGDARDEVMAAFQSKNPETSFPTIILDGDRVVLGFSEEEIRDYVKN